MHDALLPQGVLIVGLLAIVATSAWLSVIDWRIHRLPNRIVGPLAGGVALWLIVLGVINDDLERTLQAFGWGFAGFGVFFASHLVAGLGMGDVKFAWPVAATIGWFGWDSLRIAIVALALVGGIAGAVTKLRSLPDKVAYGPYMAIALGIGLAHGLAT